MADVSVINVTSLTPIAAAAIVSGQQVTIYDQGGNAWRAAIGAVVRAANTMNGCQCVLAATLTIPSAQVLTAFTTPIPFGISVPTGYFLQPLCAQVYLEYNTAAYATNTDLEIRVVGASSPFLNASTILAATLSRIIIMSSVVAPTASDTQFITAADLEVYVPFGNPTTGDSDITIYLTYALIEI